MSADLLKELFDLDGDGELSMMEKVAQFEYLQQMTAEEDEDVEIEYELAEADWRDEYYDGNLGIDPDDFDSECEYLEAVREKRNWISAISDNISNLAEELCISPEDYDTYDDFIDAVKDEL